jgi:hypothetical protein
MKYFLDTEFDDDGVGPITLISLALVAEDGRELYLVSSEWSPETVCAWVIENVVPHLGDGPRHARSEMRARVEAFIGDDPKPQIWAYFADYDWVLFCRLWGMWSNMPPAIPKCCMDLKQWAVQLDIDSATFKAAVPQEGAMHCALADARWNRQLWDYLCGESQSRAIGAAGPADRAARQTLAAAIVEAARNNVKVPLPGLKAIAIPYQGLYFDAVEVEDFVIKLAQDLVKGAACT